jgi:hypothetical protein
VANPGKYVAAGSSILLRRSVRNALAPPGADMLASREVGRAAACRAGSFNSGKKVRIEQSFYLTFTFYSSIYSQTAHPQDF